MLLRNLFLSTLILGLIFCTDCRAGLEGFTSANPYTQAELDAQKSGFPRKILNYRDAMRQNVIMLNRYAKSKNPNIVSIGLNIQLPHEQEMNPYVEIPLKFQNFFSRKLVFNHNSTAFIVAIGGFGTLDELSEVLVQIATGKHKKIPIILYGKEYWRGFIKWLKKQMLKENLITKQELALLSLADSPKEVLKILKNGIPNPIHHK